MRNQMRGFGVGWGMPRRWSRKDVRIFSLMVLISLIYQCFEALQ